MKLKIGQSRIEADFEYFVRALPALEPVEFCGLAKILGAEMTRAELMDFDKEAFERMKDSEAMQAKIAEAAVPMDEVLEAMMDKYLKLGKKRRKEINQILKDIKKSRKNEVIKNGATSWYCAAPQFCIKDL